MSAHSAQVVPCCREPLDVYSVIAYVSRGILYLSFNVISTFCSRAVAQNTEVAWKITVV